MNFLNEQRIERARGAISEPRHGFDDLRTGNGYFRVRYYIGACLLYT